MPQAVAAAVSWVASAVAGAVGVTTAAVGITGAASGWAVVAAYTVSEIALYAGLGYAVDAVQRPKQKPVGAELTYNIDPAYPREMVVGERLIGGSMVARYSKGPDRSQAHFVIQVADHPCEALLAAYGDNRLVRSSPLTHGVRTEITTYSNSGGPRVWMTWHDGRPGQAADSDLVTASAQDPEVVAGRMPAWTSDHKGAGCAYVHVEVRYDSDILTSIPTFLFKVRGAKFYDRRLDTTAGGSGSHRLNDPSTWAYTTNAAVVWDHYSLGYKVEDDDLAFGIGLSKTELPYAQFAQAADLADEDVSTGTGGGAATIKRYAINGVLSAATYFQDQLEDFQIQMAGRIVDLGGRIGLIGAEEKVSAVSLSDGDLVAGEPFQFAPKLQFSDLYGQVSGTFADPANNYQGTPYQTQYSAYAQLPDGGEAQAVTMDLPLEIHPRRAARNVSAWLARESLQPRLVGVFMPKAWKLEVGDWFDYTDAGVQIEAAMFEVIDIVKNDDFTVTITARAVDPDFLAFDNDTDPDLSVPPDVAPVSLYLDVPEVDIAVASIESGDVVVPAIEITLTSDVAVAREVLVEYGIANPDFDPAEEESEDNPRTVGPTLFDTFHVGQVWTRITKGLLPSTAYVFRTKVRAGRKESPWSAWSEVLTTGAAVPITLEDIVDLQTTIDGLAQLVLSAMVRIDETRARLGELGRVGGVPLGTTITQIRTEVQTTTQALGSELSAITARVDDAEALIVSEQSARASGDEAVAEAITLAEARLSGLEQGTSGQATAFNLLSSRVAVNENTLTVQSSSLTQVSAQLAEAQSAILARAVVTDALDAHITSVEGRVTSQASRLSVVEASAGGLTASVGQLFSALVDTNGVVNAMYSLRGVSGSSEFEFYAVASNSAPSKIRLKADQIELAGSVLIDGTLTTTKVADRAFNEIVLSEILSSTALNSAAAFQLQDSIVFLKAVAASTIRAKVQMVCGGASGSPVQIDMRLKRNGAQVGIMHSHYMNGFGTWSADWVVQGGSVGAATWTVEVRVHRSGAGATGISVSASIFDLQEIKK